ncbi:hypothetical protein, partial [uncultured Rikenella sp.]|uniref:hypothetical protein n=1 Tax=uncultured Rikenella sp. TaxID=368003 RepID=UPI002613BD3C
MSATSSDELQPAAWGGGELRGSKSRKSSAQRSGKTASVLPPEEQAQPKARPSSPPCVSLTAAPLALRRVAVARWDFISILLTAKRVKSLFTRAGDGFFVQGRIFRAPWGNLVKTHKCILT